MRVALYQINSDRDTFNTKFMSWRWRTDHDYIILPEEYDKVFDGDIQARSLAEIFVLFNVMPPEGFVGHSASVSDVIAIYDENDNPSYHFVDSAGFVDVDFGMRYAVDALQKQDSPISIREYMAMANIENEKWFDVADTVTLNRITIGKIETKEVPSQYSSLYSLYHFSDLLSRKIQFWGTSCKDNFVIGNLSGYVRENELLFRSYALSHWSITPDTDTSSFVNQKLYRGTATRADITRITQRLGDEIAKVYGWDIPKSKTKSENKVTSVSAFCEKYKEQESSTNRERE